MGCTMQDESACVPIEVYIIMGLSGAGKSTALQVFEDLGYFAVDGLPVSLVCDMVFMMQHESMCHFRGIVLGISAHNEQLAGDMNAVLQKLRKHSAQPHVIFLETDETELLRRYATTRRPHPLERGGLGLEGALASERKHLRAIRSMADIVLDTTTFSIHDLRRALQQHYGPQNKTHSVDFLRPMKINIVSFGFKYGVPKEADMLLDVRFLPNPYFDLELRSLSGKNAEIDTYVFQNNLEQAFSEQLLDFILFTMSLMEAEGRYRVTVAIGCTGGRHRSVATAERVFKALKQAGYAVSVEHKHMSLDKAHM